MLHKKEKAQGLVEFALILPAFLLLLLGVIEAARIIWAYTTVQTAAREATRYAVSGRPYAGSPGSSACLVATGDPNASAPWVCNPISRTTAIENVAISRTVSSINVSTICRSLGYNVCRETPNAFAVQVVGQYTDPLTPTVVLTQAGHAGQQGLNVKISTYYNLQMIDPIFDVIMGGETIEIRAELSMQNEGIDKAFSGAPPPAIGNTNNITSTGGTGTGPNGERIWALNYSVNQGDSLPVHLESHFNSVGPYDIYLGVGSQKFKICAAVNTDSLSNNADFSCPISGAIPPGFYDLYSTLLDSDTVVATADQQVEVKTSAAPRILVDNGVGGNSSAYNSTVEIELLSHQSPDEPFDLYLVYGSGPTVQQIFTNIPAVPSGPITWQVPDLGTPNPCPAGGTIPCFIQSRRTVSPTVVYASGDFFLSRPEIVLSGGNLTYAQGETIHAFIRGHIPDLQYDLKISGGGVSCWLGRTPLVGPSGSTTTPVDWDVPLTSIANCISMPSSGLPDGIYQITSHQATGGTPRNPSSMTTANQVALLDNVQISTPSGPFLTIDGGYTWPVGSVINIQAHRHLQANNPYYFQFGSWRVPIAGSSPANTFNVGAAQTYVTSYQIPLTATIGVTATIPVTSYVNATNAFVASRNVTVFPIPVILVLQGSTVTPDTIITIQLNNHAPNSSYQIFYANQFLAEVLTDANGQAQLSYDLKQLSIFSPPGDPNTYGNPYPLTSRFLLNGATAATTQLTLRPADLRVVSIQVPSNPILNSNLPFTFTIQNTSSVTITRFFDTDLFLDPSPQVPSYGPPFNFPGDYKLWRNSLAPGASFTIVQPFFIGSYGPHRLYSYADTSKLILEGNETNNILSNTLTISCTPTLITDTFSSLSAWATQLYGNAENNGVAPQIVSDRLRLTSDGSNTALSDDNALTPPRGYTFYRRTSPIATSSGLDVRVQVADAPDTAGSKAGLEVRDTLLPASPKLEFGLTRIGSNYQYQVVFRDSVSPTPVIVNAGSAPTPTTGSPVWLRIQRYGGTNTFLFYASTNPASWGAPLYSATIRLGNQLEFGLFMNSATNNTSYQTALFDNFVFGDPNSCAAAQGQPPIDNTPPGLTSCTDPLAEKSFENPPLTRWILAGAEGVTTAPGSAHTGNTKLLAPTFDSSFRQPFFYQRFTMPSFVISSTTNFRLNLFKNVDVQVDGDDPNDRFYVLITTSPSLSGTHLTNPVQVTDGVWGSTYTPVEWRNVALTLEPASGINLEDYAGQDLYVYFYNNSNSTCTPPNTNCHATKFYFDDVTLSPCTINPLPTTITTRIRGEAIVHQASAGDLRIPGVRIWAYAEGGELYETTTIQNGEFNFYNLPATSTGLKYFIYSEHSIVNPINPSVINTFTANATVLLRTSNNDTSPVTTQLHLY